MSAGGDARSTDESLARLLKRTEQAVLRAKSAALKPIGLTLAQYVVLAELDARPRTTSAELARSCLVSPQAMMVLLKTLEERGLVARSRHPRHPNVLETDLTEPGREALAEGRLRAEPVEKHVEGALAAAETKTLRALLERLADAATEERF